MKNKQETTEQKERAYQELCLNLKYQSNHTEKEFWEFVDFLYGNEFKKVLEELKNV